MTYELAHVYACLVTTFAVALLPKSMSNYQSWSRDFLVQEYFCGVVS